MDYVEAFRNLRTNNKYGRKSPHKAVLMLTVIELFEKNILEENEIRYDDTLKTTFLKVWNRVLPDEPLFHPEAYLPFWYLQSDSFWHIIPIRGKEDILSLMRDTNIKPSEVKLNDSVKCAELDDDLYFLMTITSGRSSLKRALLETYTSLSESQIDRLAESTDNAVDHSLSAMDEYEQILSSTNSEKATPEKDSSGELVQQFRKLNDDLQIALNYEYYSFLKLHRGERSLLREICPDVFALYDRLTNHPLCKTDISPSLAFVYDNFLCDLKIALMSENGAMDLVDKIDHAIAVLRGNDATDDVAETEDIIGTTDITKGKETESIKNGYSDLEVEHVYLDSSYNIVKTVTTTSLNGSSEKNETAENRKGKPWTHEEEERITHYFERGMATAEIAERIGRTEVAIKLRLAKLGLIEYTYGQNEAIGQPSNDESAVPDDFLIENGFEKASILNKRGEKVFSTDGKLKGFNGKIYRLNLKRECFTIKDMLFNGRVWMKGSKKIVAYPQTELYRVLDSVYDYCEAVDDIFDGPSFEECKMKVDGIWYDYQGDVMSDPSRRNDATDGASKQNRDDQRIVKHPLYAVRKQALLRAMGYFRLPAKIRDIARTISRTAWGAPIREDDVEEIISTLKEVESIDDKYMLRKR